MLLNSASFVIFFIPFFLLYRTVFNKGSKRRNIFLLFGSYSFYCIAEWKFLPLLIAVSAINYFLGLMIYYSERKKRFYLTLGLIAGIGSLAYFKYFNFFIDSINSICHTDIHLMTIIAPLGISFFTFRVLSYLIDIYYGKIKPTTDWIAFFNYVSFFPAIIAGPIDRARPFLAQLETCDPFNRAMATDGMRQILWGLFKKTVIADNCALFTNEVFNLDNHFSGSAMALGLFLYAIQIYADFSGYTDMAVGVAKLLGFRIAINFNYPYFSENVIEYWRKWHISLTQWLTDYVFTPLTISFRNLGKSGIILAVIINMIAVGVWHGANWTYAAFGLLHGLYFVPLLLTGAKMTPKKKKDASLRRLPSFTQMRKMTVTFFFVSMAFVLFRSDTISDAAVFYSRMFSPSLFDMSGLKQEINVCVTLGFILFMLILEWNSRQKEYALQIDNIKSKAARIGIYWFFALLLLFFSSAGQNTFIYAQF